MAKSVRRSSGRNIISTMVPSSRTADAVGTMRLLACSSLVSTQPGYVGLSKTEGACLCLAFGAYCVELEVDEVSSVEVATSVSGAAVLDPLLNGEDVAETNGGAFWMYVPFGCNAY